jgi:hypothetical protein
MADKTYAALHGHVIVCRFPIGLSFRQAVSSSAPTIRLANKGISPHTGVFTRVCIFGIFVG